MAVTTVLSTTTLSAPATAFDTVVTVADTSNIAFGNMLYVDRELMDALRVTGVANQLVVRRGVGGTASAPHQAGATLTIGSADQFYSSDPMGVPPSAVPVSPWINVLTGDTWFSQGDEEGTGPRWWQKQVTSYGVGAGGINLRTPSVASST